MRFRVQREKVGDLSDSAAALPTRAAVARSNEK
jgi:hypothetical protein